MTHDELLYNSLSHYFHVDLLVPPEGAISSYRLDDPELLRSVIARQPADMADLGQPRVSGIMTAKLYGTIAVAAIFAATLFDRLLPVDRRSVYLLPGGEHGFRFVIPPGDVAKAAGLPADAAARQEALRRHLERLFEGHIAPVWDLLAENSAADHRSMWSLLSTNTATMFLRGRQEPYRSSLRIRPELQRRMDADESLVFAHGPEGPFPGRDRNPLVQPTRLFTPPEGAGPPIYLRTKCCLRYRLRVAGEAVPYCSTCPKVSEHERLRLMQSAHETKDRQ